ncbi:hypothetical protein OIU79_019980 [Salix purpurea]|uniref:Uncharacterized protein n=1 Tax=Salix purpurea TaxID=77065 RepID=A0A9Q0SKI8_SALPP|nr:hypothetical protein OIU79_019980 [Salix purpurea]
MEGRDSLSRLAGKRRRFLPNRRSPFHFHFHIHPCHIIPDPTSASGNDYLVENENENGRMMSPMESERNPNTAVV